MPRYRQKRKDRRVAVGVLVFLAIAAGGWWLYFGDDEPRPADTQLAASNMPALTSTRPEIEPTVGPRRNVVERGESHEGSTTPRTIAPSNSARSQQLLAAGRQALDRNDWVSARELLSEAMELGVDKSEQVRLRANLTRIGEQTIFSQRMFANDPFAERYIIQPGDALAKIAKTYNVSADFLASINGIRDKNLIRAGQTLKVVRGPFHAAIDKRTYTLDVYLGEGSSRTFVKRFKVGLGEDDSTPTGTWRVKNKLKNPTYFPPRGGRFIRADDPENPLGERWIGIEGVSGEAAGQQRYGIHGTIEPETIGQSASLGCIRMYNEDAEALFDYFIVNHSTVTVK